jgi:hypothetical protein
VLLLFWRNAAPTFGTAVITGRVRTVVIFDYSAPAAVRVGSSVALVGQRGASAVAGARVQARGASVVISVELQYASLIADLSDGSWTNELGSNVNLYASVDEGSPSDADYIQSSLSPVVPDEVKLRFGPLFDPQVNNYHTVRYQYRKDDPGFDQINLTVRLYRADGVTVIGEQTHLDIGTLTEGVLVITSEAANTIPGVDYGAGLILGLSAVKVGG